MRNSNRGSLVIGLVIIAFGIFYLLRNFGVIPYHMDLGKLWPVAMVVVGIWMIFDGSCKNRGVDRDE